jgi:hypothetical protein
MDGGILNLIDMFLQAGGDTKVSVMQHMWGDCSRSEPDIKMSILGKEAKEGLTLTVLPITTKTLNTFLLLMLVLCRSDEQISP